MAVHFREALRAAAKVLADEVRRQAGHVSRETEAAVNIRETGDGFDVNAGNPGGRWGWEPIQGYMFDEGRPHPLFGDKSHWYRQRHYPFISLAADIAADRAADAYADKAVEEIKAEYGFV